MNKQEPSSLKVIMMGELIVNVPVIFTIILAFTLLLYAGLGILLSSLPATMVGWWVWSKMLDLWKKWALKKHVSRERLFRLGKIGFINYYRNRIFDMTQEEDVHEANNLS